MTKKDKILRTAAVLLTIMAIAMIYIGAFHGPKVLLPPIITGLGFFVIAWALGAMKSR